MKTFVITAAMLAAFVGVMPEAKAGSCESVASTTAKQWKNWGEVAKASGCAVATVASEGAIPFPACLAAANKYDKAVQDMIKKWNDGAKNGKGTIGPRLMDIGDTQSGRLQPPFGERVFVAPAPLLSDEVKITLKKTDGKAKTEVTVCAEDAQKKRTKLWTFEVDSGNGTVGKVFSKTLTGVKNQILTVHLANKNAVNTFAYDVKVEPGRE